MTEVFADTSYWLATVRPTDPWAGAAHDARQMLGEVHLLTTDEVLTEFLEAMSAGGDPMRAHAARMVRAILTHPGVEVLPRTKEAFLEGLVIYEARREQNYNMIDCISMAHMRSRGVTAALTNDRRFAKEGFTVLMMAGRSRRGATSL